MTVIQFFRISLKDTGGRAVFHDPAGLHAMSEVMRHFAATRRWEEREFRKHITDWELERYFEIL